MYVNVPTKVKNNAPPPIATPSKRTFARCCTSRSRAMAGPAPAGRCASRPRPRAAARRGGRSPPASRPRSLTRATPTRPTSPPATSADDVAPHRPGARSAARRPRRRTGRRRRAGPACRAPGACGRRAASRSRGERDADRGQHEQQAREADRTRSTDPVGDAGPRRSRRERPRAPRPRSRGPARDGLTSKSRESSGRIACVEYIVANIPVAPSRNAGDARTLLGRDTGRHARSILLHTAPAARHPPIEEAPTSSQVTPSAYGHVEQLLADGSLRRPRRRRRDRAAADGCPDGSRPRPRALGHLGALPRARGGARRAPRYVEAGCDVISTEHLVDPQRARGRDARAARAGRGRALDGRRPPRHPARPQGRATRADARTSARSPSRSPRRSTRSSAARHPRAAATRVRGRAARPHPARDADADPRPADLRDGRAAARDRAARLALASAAAGTASAASTASTGARPRATSSAAPRGASRRWASARCSSTACRSTTCPGCSPWLRDFTDMPLGVYPNLGYLGRDELALRRPRSAPRSTRASRSSGARRAPRSSAAAAARRPTHIAAAADGARGHEAGPPARSEIREPSADPAAAQRGRRPWRDERGRSLFPLPFPELTVDAGRLRPDPGELPALEAPVPRRGVGDGRALPRRRLRLRDPVRPARAERRRARARDRHRPRRRREHARERVPQRRRRPDDGRGRSTSTSGSRPSGST